MAFRKIASVDDLWSGEIMAAECDGELVLLVNMDGRIGAYEDACPHLRTRLSEGSLNGTVLTCSTHGWQFDVTTGRGINPRITCLRSFPVQLEEGHILVDVSGKLQG
jgi:toluene monooxygenase system ferredoxin subunit